MGAFLSLASGFSTGAAEAYDKIATEKRAQSRKEDDLTASAIQTAMNDPSLDFDTHLIYAKQLWKLRGVPQAMQDQLELGLRHHKADYDAHVQANAPQAQAIPGQASQGVAGPLPNMSGGAAPDVNGPATPLPSTGAIPALPAPPESMAAAPSNPTQGQMAAAYQRPLTLQAEQDKANAVRQAQRQEITGALQDKIDLIESTAKRTDISDQTKAYALRALGAIKTPTGAVKQLAHPMFGEELISALGTDVLNGVAIDPKARYNALMDATGQIIGGSAYTETPVAHALTQEPNGTWSELQLDRTGAVIGKTPNIPPPAAYAQRNASNSHQEYIDVGGEKRLVTVYSNSISQRTPPVPPGGAGTPEPGTPPAGATPGTASVGGRPMPGPPVPRNGAGSSSTPTSIPKTLTQKQKMDTTVGVNATDRALLAMQTMKDNLDVLDNPAIAAAISIQADANASKLAKFAASQVTKGNAKAEAFTAAAIAATEDVNKIRGAFGATAFRGHDAFNAMISQAGQGNLLADPEVVRLTLGKTVGDLQTMRDEQAKFIGVPAKYADQNTGSPYGSTPSSPLPQSSKLTVEQAKEYLRQAKGDRKRAEQLAKIDGKTF